jgi:hypothetical protein
LDPAGGVGLRIDLRRRRRPRPEDVARPGEPSLDHVHAFRTGLAGEVWSSQLESCLRIPASSLAVNAGFG